MDIRVRQIYEQYSVGIYINTRWTPSLKMHSKLKGQRKTLKFGSDTSVGPSLSPQSLSLKTILLTLSFNVYCIQYRMSHTLFSLYLNASLELEPGAGVKDTEPEPDPSMLPLSSVHLSRSCYS